MAVVFDAASTTPVDSGAGTTNTSLSGTPITVGSGTNRLLTVFLVFGVGTLPTGISVTWDVGGTNQAMSTITGASGVHGTDPLSMIWYQLVAPTSGAKTLTASWTGGTPAIMGALSVTGADQTGGTTTCRNGGFSNQGGSGTSTSDSITIASATGNMTVAGFGTAGGATFSSTTATQDWIDNLTSNLDGASCHTAGSASNTMTGTLASADFCAAAGFDIVAATSGVDGSTSQTIYRLKRSWF